MKIQWPKIENGLTIENLVARLLRDTNRNAVKEGPKVNNIFRPQGQRLVGDINAVILGAVAPQGFEIPVYDVPEEEKQEAINQPNKFAQEVSVPENPMFAKPAKGVKLRRGQKRCVTCGTVHGARKIICECGYDFKNKVNPRQDKIDAAKNAVGGLIARLKDPAEVGVGEPRRRYRRRRDNQGNERDNAFNEIDNDGNVNQIPKIPKIIKRKIKKRWVKPEAKEVPDPVKLAIKRIVQDAAGNVPKQRKIGKGRKICPDCNTLLGARTRYCKECNKRFY